MKDLEVEGLSISPHMATVVVKDFLAYLHYATQYGIAVSTGYGSMDPADDTLVEWKIKEWAKKFEA